jgi:hypothetical protein
MQMIRDNWDHYRQLYYISEDTYRNDYAMSIAMNIVDGHTLSAPAIPWPLISITSLSRLTQVDTDTYRVEYENSNTDNRTKWILLKQRDFHAMGKKTLGDQVLADALSFSSFIYTDNYFLTTLDIWLLVNKYKIPTIFISQKFLLQTKYNILKDNT